jgi:hypothetical protein
MRRSATVRLVDVLCCSAEVTIIELGGGRAERQARTLDFVGRMVGVTAVAAALVATFVAAACEDAGVGARIAIGRSWVDSAADGTFLAPVQDHAAAPTTVCARDDLGRVGAVLNVPPLDGGPGVTVVKDIVLDHAFDDVVAVTVAAPAADPDPVAIAEVQIVDFAPG